jgi:anaerobic selenocysteine-containing dehydrogenase
VPNQFPGGAPIDPGSAQRIGEAWGFPVPSWRGLNAVEMIDAAHRGEIDVFYQIGGNFLETLPEPEYVREAVERIPLRVHQDIVLSSQMFAAPAETVVLLPAQTRYEQTGGGTETSTERRILFSPEIPGPRIGEALAEWEIAMRIAEKAAPDRTASIHFEDANAIRREIGKVVSFYDGIQDLSKVGDQIQWGGTRLCEKTADEDGGKDTERRDAERRDGDVARAVGTGRKTVPAFPLPDGRARFTALGIEPRERPSGFTLSTRRGKQFNSMIQHDRDPLTGANRRDVLMNVEDARRLGISDGDEIVLRSSAGEMEAICRIAPIAAGNVQAHWPEANILIARGLSDPECGIPDFNTEVQISRAR